RTERIIVNLHVLSRGVAGRRAPAAGPRPARQESGSIMIGVVAPAVDRVRENDLRRRRPVSAAPDRDGLDGAGSGGAHREQFRRFARERREQRGERQEENRVKRSRWERVVVSRSAAGGIFSRGLRRRNPPIE